MCHCVAGYVAERWPEFKSSKFVRLKEETQQDKVKTKE